MNCKTKPPCLSRLRPSSRRRPVRTMPLPPCRPGWPEKKRLSAELSAGRPCTRPCSISRRLRQGLLSREEAKLVYVPVLAAFCQSDIGRRMAESPELHREYPFTVLLAGGDPLPETETGEQILIQGVIDCLFREDDAWILVDYKSDRLETADAFRSRYAVQLAVYKRAVEHL